MKDRHGNECKTVPVDGHFDMTKAALALLQSKNCGDLTVGDLGAAICNAIAAAPKFEAPEVDDAMALRISEKYHGIQFEAYFSIGLGRDMIAAVRSELGPTLGLVTREPINEGKLWSLIRNVLSQGCAIQLDRASMSGYEEYSARLDAAAAERVVDFVNLCNAQKTEK